LKFRDVLDISHACFYSTKQYMKVRVEISTNSECVSRVNVKQVKTETDNT